MGDTHVQGQGAAGLAVEGHVATTGPAKLGAQTIGAAQSEIVAVTATVEEVRVVRVEAVEDHRLVETGTIKSTVGKDNASVGTVIHLPGGKIRSVSVDFQGTAIEVHRAGGGIVDPGAAESEHAIGGSAHRAGINAQWLKEGVGCVFEP